MFFTSVALAVTDLVPPERRTASLGRQSVMTYTGFVIGPILVDRLVAHGWSIVWILPACLHVLTTVVALGMKETRPVAVVPSAARAGFDLRVVRPAVGILVANFTFASVVSFLPEYTERMHITHPGTLFAVYAFTVLVIRSMTGKVADRVGPARFMVPSILIGGIGLVILAVARHPWQSYVGIGIVGAGIGGTFPAATSAALARVGSAERGRAMGTALAVGDVGQACAGPLVGHLSISWGFRWVYGIPAVVAFVGVLIVATMPEVLRPGWGAGP
jgi:MFS family permease